MGRLVPISTLVGVGGEGGIECVQQKTAKNMNLQGCLRAGSRETKPLDTPVDFLFWLGLILTLT